MVQKEITNKDIDEMCEWLEYYDNHRKFPFQKVRVNVMLSKEALEKLKGMNRSSVINELVINQL